MAKAMIFFHPSHLKQIISPASEPVMQGLEICSGRDDYHMVSCFHEKELYAVMGARRLHRTCGEIFMIPFGSPSAFGLHRSALAIIRYGFEKLGYTRLQATSKLGLTRDENWLKRLGFQYEGILKAYDPLTGEDHSVYGRVR